MTEVTVDELEWCEQTLGEIDFPKERLTIVAGFGSGLTSAPGEEGVAVWAITDRGPNLKLADAVELYGWSSPSGWKEVDGAKLMPRPDIGPTLALLDIGASKVSLRRSVRLKDSRGGAISGLPIPESGHSECEPVLGLDGRHLEPDPNGMDTEGLALLGDGTFWASEEYGPSLVRISSQGEILLRLVPKGVRLESAAYPVVEALPAIAARRHLNRGFEALAVSPSNGRLYVAFQSPLAHPTKEEHEKGRHVRIWQLDPEGAVRAQYLYPLDEPKTFLRDKKKGKVKRSDLKVCEIVALDEDRLLVLERASETSKIYRVQLSPARALGPEHLEVETRPTVEELSCRGEQVPELQKELLFTSDDWPQVGPDIEGMAPLDERSLLIVSDNDFGCEGKQTGFWRLTFSERIAG